MRLLRVLNEQMTKPASGVETNNEQPAPEARVEQDVLEENDCAATSSPGTANGM